MAKTMQRLSVIVPTWNEENNVELLTEQIDNVLKNNKTIYEIVFIDDHSTDRTVSKINKLKKKYPVEVYLKEGKQGKAFSLIEGFTKAKYDVLCMIDADLQYPPAALPEMLAKIKSGADIVVANRSNYHAGKLRQLMSTIFHSVFARMLHGFREDVQSGLKVFRREVALHIKVTPSSWTFDMEFLLKAKHAGYNITSIDIEFQKRHAGTSKIAVLRSSYEIATSAVSLKVKDSGIVPFSTRQTKEKGEGFHHNGKTFVHHTQLAHADSAHKRMTRLQYGLVFSLIILFFAGLFINWHLTLVTLVTFLILMYFTDLLFNLYLIYRSYTKRPDINIRTSTLDKSAYKNWPMYTVLCPLYKEWEVLGQFTKAMSELDYPKNKLQVMLLLEEDDKESIAKVRQMDLPNYFDVVVVPDSQPKTKPKACNYGLTKAKGEYVVIYDAEDIPDPLQLKKAVVAFKKATKQILCIQAKLNFYNTSQNVLTRLFALEYSLWFDLVLSGLQAVKAPIPLGGTSNHFRTKDILALNKWDPFNVTEDADLGMRLVKRGYRTALLDSYTMEEANGRPFSWIKQRSRWIKGYIQTYYVHMRRPQDIIKMANLRNFLIFQLIIGGKILSMLINPVMWLLTIAYFAFKPYTGHFIESLFLLPIFYIGMITMVVGNFLYMYFYMLGAARQQQWPLMKFALLTPFYWLFMSMAAGFAAWEFIFKPHYWHKTQHGLHLVQDDQTDGQYDTDPQLSPVAA